MAAPIDKNTVALFVTCLIDNLRPDIGFKVVSILEECGYQVQVPLAQTCCGQANYNGGDPENAKAVARQVIDVFEEFEYTVVASGSCGGMIKQHYLELLKDEPRYLEKATKLAAKTYEFSTFLTEVAEYQPQKTLQPQKITYHDACAGLRELGIKTQPRALLEKAGHEIKEMSEPETCCGFGGAFCVKYPEISDNIVEQKVIDGEASGAEVLVTGDLGCLMNMEGKLKRKGSALEVRHLVEMLIPEVSG